MLLGVIGMVVKFVSYIILLMKYFCFIMKFICFSMIGIIIEILFFSFSCLNYLRFKVLKELVYKI